MDHYFILMHNGSLNVEDQLLFINYLNSLLLIEDDINYCSDLVPHINPILKRNSVHLANFNIANKEFMELWLEVHGVITQKSIFQTENENCSTPLLENDTSVAIAEALHALADQLPQNGTYHLDVIISSDILENVELSNHLDLAGTFFRLYLWHQAAFSIICKSSEQKEIIHEWCEVSHAQVILSESKILHAPVVWRGRFSFATNDEKSDQHLIGLQLKLETKLSLNWTNLRKMLNVADKTTFTKNTFVLSPYIKILDRCDISTIPAYMFAPANFTLSVIENTIENNAACQFIEYLNSNPQNCFIVRMNFRKLEKVLLTPELNTVEWRKAVVSGNFAPPKYDMKNSKEYAIFVVHKNPQSSSEASVYLLMAPSQMCSNFPYEVMAANCSREKEDKENKILEKALHKLKHWQVDFHNYVETKRKFQAEILSEWLKIKKEKLLESKAELTIEEMQTVFENVTEILDSQANFEENSETEVEQTSPYEINETDPCDWPERLHLLHKQIQEDKSKNYDPLNGIITSPKKTIIVSAKDIGKYFNPTGEANAPPTETLEILKPIEYSNFNHMGLQQHSPSKSVHDVYCNYDSDCEEGETTRMKLKDHFVTEQTSSSCCNEQLAPTYTAIPLVRGKKRRTNSQSPNKSVKRRKITPKTLQSKANIRRLENNKLQRDFCHSQSLKLQGRHSVPIRRSPRKHPTQPFIPSKKKISNKRIPIKFDELSEKHKMKLREAVVVALESHTISVNHEMFKPCARKLFAVCKPFVKDIIGKGNTSAQMKQIAAAHAKQVVDFEMQKKNTN